MMIICNEHVDEISEFVFFRGVWERLGYFLASSLVCIRNYLEPETIIFPTKKWVQKDAE